MARIERPIKSVPKKELFIPSLKDSSSQEDSVELLVKGQGVVSLVLKERKTFSWFIDDGGKGVELKVSRDMIEFINFTIHYDEGRKVRTFDSKTSEAMPGIGLDEDPLCQYWLSLDFQHDLIRYGKGEIRNQTVIRDFQPKGVNLNEVRSVEVIGKAESIWRWRDPVTINPPLLVVDHNEITMDDVALNQATVANNLTSACQVLYGNVSGSNFNLDTEDWNFVEAIEESIRDPNGWCYKTLKEKAKADEFGGGEEETYLRITLGVNQGDSPGIPYVLEIWPPKHGSPIHNHADANAIIRVLHGEITVGLFSMLSTFHQEPFESKTLCKDQVTWISPGLNQTHQLKNESNDVTCMTIQCYMYGEFNFAHYEYFDFIDEKNNKIEQFTPNSDMGFIEFKERMKSEWDHRRR